MYKYSFYYSPLPIWILDFTELYTFIQNLKKRRIKNIGNYLDANPKVLADCAGRFVVLDVNKAAIKLYSAKSKDNLLSSIEKTFTKDYFDTFKKLIISIYNNNKTFQAETVITDFKNQFHHAVMQCRTYIDKKSNNVIGVVILSDISKNKKQEEQILNTKNLLHSILNAAIHPIVSKDLQGRITLANNAFAKYHQCNPDKLIGKIDYELFEKKSAALLKSYDKKVIKTKTPLYSIDHFQFKGQKLLFKSTRVPLFDNNNNLIGVTVFSEEITRQKEVEKELTFHSKLLSSISEAVIASHDNILKLKLNNTITYWNKGAEKLFGWKKEEVIGKKVRSVLKTDFLGVSTDDIINSVINNGFWEGDTIAKDKFGKKKFIYLTITPIYENGKIVGCIGINRDITQQKLYENKINEQLLELQRWYDVTLGREERIIDLKREVNNLLKLLGKNKKYKSV